MHGDEITAGDIPLFRKREPLPRRARLYVIVSLLNMALIGVQVYIIQDQAHTILKLAHSCSGAARSVSYADAGGH